VTLVKLDIVGGNLSQQLAGFLIALEFVFGKTHEKLIVSRFGNQPAFILGVSQIFDLSRLIRLFDEVGYSRQRR